SDEAGLDVTIAVALAMTKARLHVRNGALEPEQHVVDHVGIGVFIDGDGRRGVRAVDHTQAGGGAAGTDGMANAVGDFDELVAASGVQIECGHDANSSTFVRIAAAQKPGEMNTWLPHGKTWN